MNQQLTITTKQCDRCGHACWPDDRYCGECGASLSAESVAAPGTELTDDSRSTGVTSQTSHAILNNRTAVLCILFCVGPIGLPLLWFSPRFSRAFKVMTSIAYVAVTVVIPLGVAYYFLDVSVRPLLDALRQMHG